MQVLLKGTPDARQPSHPLDVFLSITERNPAEELHVSEGRRPVVMDDSTAVVWTMDDQGRYVSLNHPFETPFGVRRKDRYVKTEFDVWTLDGIEDFRRNDREVLSSGLQPDTIKHTKTPGAYPLYLPDCQWHLPDCQVSVPGRVRADTLWRHRLP